MKLHSVARYLLTLFLPVQFAGIAVPSLQAQNSLLWEVKSSKGATSYLFGTIHVADSAVFMQRDTVLALLDGASSFHAELNLDSMFAMQNPLIMMLPPDKTLASFYTEAEMAEIRVVLKERFGPLAVGLERMKPAAIAVMLSMESAENAADMVQLSVDQFLWNRAASLGIPRFGIERISEQLALLDSIPPSILLDVIRDGNALGPSVDDLTKAYAGERLEEIAALIDSVSSVETFMQRLNDDRNVLMIERLQPTLQQGNAFIAVGTAHLPGKQGLIEGLRKAGYSVRPITEGKRVQWLKVPDIIRRN